MNKRTHIPPLALAAMALVAAGCSSGSGDGSAQGGASNVDEGQVITGEASSGLDEITWYGDYRPLYTMDPIKLADYPEQTIIPNVCEPMLKVEPDYTISTGAVAADQQDPTTLILALQPGVSFSDGSAVTAEDVAFSIERHLDPKNLSNFAARFQNIASVEVTGEREVTVKLKEPQLTLPDTLATMAGAIVKREFVERTKEDFGAPTTGVMCTGPYEMTSFDGTNKLVLTRNENYWNEEDAALTKTVNFVFPADPSALANGLTSGEIDGALNIPSNLVPTLRDTTNGELFLSGEGSTPINLDLIVTATTGPFAAPEVRQALSMALDRAAIAEKIYLGAADPLYRVSGPGTWSYAEEAFADSYEALKQDPDIEAAARMIEDAAAEGSSAVFAYPGNDPQSQQLASVLQETGKAIGLDLQIKGLPLQQYGSLFADPTAREGIDLMLTKNYVELPDPAAMDEIYGMTGGSTNFSDYSNATVDENLVRAAATADLDERAGFVIAAEEQLDKDLPSIPIVGLRALAFQADGVTGAPLTFAYMSSAWAARLGAP